MTTTPRRHVVQGLLGGLLLGLGVALLLVQLRVTAVPTDLVVGVGLLVGLTLGTIRLPREAPRSDVPPG